MTLMSAFILAIIASVTAGPRFIMFYGPPNQTPVVLDDWRENMQLMLALNDAPGVEVGELRDRPSLKVAMFWGPEWERFVESRRPLSELDPLNADQFGRFYP